MKASEIVSTDALNTSHTGLPVAVLRSVLCILTLACGGWLAYKQMFTGVMPYDDEGGLLLTLLSYLKRDGLYISTFALYGPFYFGLQHAMHVLLRLPVDHDGTRCVTLVDWLSSSVLSLYFIYRLTRNLLLSCACFLISLVTSVVLCYEPGHPQAIILVLIQSALVLSLFAQGRWSQHAFIGIGMIAAFLCLTKINVGIFFTAAVSMTCIAMLPPSKLKRLVILAAAFFAIVMPIALMHTYLATWAWPFCLMAVSCIAVLSLTIQNAEVENPITPNQIGLLLLGGVAGAAAVLLNAIGRGSSVQSLLKGIILVPLHHPTTYYIPFLIPGYWFPVVGVLLLFTVCMWTFGDRLGSESSLLGTIKLLLGLATLAVLLFKFRKAPAFVLPLLPILYLGAMRERRALEWMLPRLFLSFLVGFEFLQVYPVAGSQLRIALVPAVTWGCLLFSDGLSSRRLGEPGGAMIRHSSLISVGLQTLLLVFVWHTLDIETMGPLLNLPGARHIHVSDEDATTYRTLATEIHSNCDVLFTMPGMGSLNLWSEVPTANGYNFTAWMTVFSDEEQANIVGTLRQTRRPCVVYNARLVSGWMPEGTARLSASPLARYIFCETHPISLVSNYQLRVPLEDHDQFGISTPGSAISGFPGPISDSTPIEQRVHCN